MKTALPLLLLATACSDSGTGQSRPPAAPVSVQSSAAPSASADIAAPSPKRPGEGLGETLLAQAGAEPALIVVERTGLVVRTPGRILATLAPGDVTLASHDPRADLVWLVRNGQLEVIDLRSAQREVVPIVSSLAPDLGVVVLSEGSSTALGVSQTPVHLELDFSENPSLRVVFAIEDHVSTERRAAVREAQLVGQGWLTSQWRRLRHRRTRAPAPVSRSEYRFPALHCDDTDRCGLSLPFGESGWHLFVSEYDCGDYCHSLCLLVNPKTGKVARPVARPMTWTEPSRAIEQGSCGPFRFSRDGKRFFHGNSVCHLDGDCSDLSGRIVGVLNGGASISL